jgi:hypothetical protein
MSTLILGQQPLEALASGVCIKLLLLYKVGFVAVKVEIKSNTELEHTF